MLVSFPFVIFILFSLILVADVHDFCLFMCCESVSESEMESGENNRKKNTSGSLPFHSLRFIYIEWCVTWNWNVIPFCSIIHMIRQWNLRINQWIAPNILLRWSWYFGAKRFCVAHFWRKHCKLSREGRRRDAFFTFWFWFRRHLPTSVIRECVVYSVSSKLLNRWEALQPNVVHRITTDWNQ